MVICLISRLHNLIKLDDDKEIDPKGFFSKVDLISTLHNLTRLDKDKEIDTKGLFQKLTSILIHICVTISFCR